MPTFSESRPTHNIKTTTKYFKAAKSNIRRISRQHFLRTFLNVRKMFSECFARIFYECSLTVRRRFLRECSVNVRKTFAECFAQIFYECSENVRRMLLRECSVNIRKTFAECFTRMFGEHSWVSTRGRFGEHSREHSANVTQMFAQHLANSIWLAGTSNSWRTKPDCLYVHFGAYGLYKYGKNFVLTGSVSGEFFVLVGFRSDEPFPCTKCTTGPRLSRRGRKCLHNRAFFTPYEIWGGIVQTSEWIY